MNNADKIFINVCDKIMSQPDSNYQETRARWYHEKEDLYVPASTKHIVNVVNEYPLRDGCEFPILTLRKTNWEKALDEILWIYQKKSNKVSELNSHIWDSWTDKNGTIGKAYGYQCGKKYFWKDIGMTMDQVDRAIYDLKHNPTSRRIMINMWNVEDLNDMELQPCAYSLTLNVCNGELYGLLNQRSQDMLTASNWNVVQYSLLLMMIGKAVNIPVAKLTHVICDCHIYDAHIPLVKELLKNAVNEYEPLIIGNDVIINPNVTDFYDFTIDDVAIRNYKYSEFNYKIPVAV